MSVVVAFLNAGRGTRAQVEATYARVARELPPGAILCLNEIGEGDVSYDDRALLRAAFPGQRLLWGDTREPITIDQPTADKWTVLACQRQRAMSGIARQSPPRHLYETTLRRGTGAEVALMTGHYPAGAHNGTRPAKVKAQLLAGYARMWRLERKAIRAHHKAGRDVISAMDRNWRKAPRGHRKERTVAHNGPDWIRVLPARGRAVEVVREGRIENSIEGFHPCLWVELAFTNKEKP